MRGESLFALPFLKTRASQLVLAIAMAAVAPLGCSSSHDEHSHQGTGSSTLGTVTSDSGKLSVAFSSSPDPLERGENELWLDVHDAETHEPVDDLTLEVEPYMPAHHHGSSAVPVVAAEGKGRYHVTNVVFTMAGDWEIRVHVKDPFEDALRATVTIP